MNETLKAKFLTLIVREYRKFKEVANIRQHKKQAVQMLEKIKMQAQREMILKEEERIRAEQRARMEQQRLLAEDTSNLTEIDHLDGRDEPVGGNASSGHMGEHDSAGGYHSNANNAPSTLNKIEPSMSSTGVHFLQHQFGNSTGQIQRQQTHNAPNYHQLSEQELAGVEPDRNTQYNPMPQRHQTDDQHQNFNIQENLNQSQL